MSFSTKAPGSTSPIQRPATQEILLIFRRYRSSRGLGAICLSVLVFGGRLLAPPTKGRNFKPAFVLSVALLSLADDACKLLDGIYPSPT